MRLLGFAPFILATACLLHAQNTPTANQSSKPPSPKEEEAKALLACGQMVSDELKVLKIPPDRGSRFQGKVSEATAMCRGGYKALQFRGTPWVDWGNYWGTGDMSSLPTGFLSSKLPAERGVAGALLDLELQRVELIKFNLFDNSGTYPEYVQGRNGVGGPALKVWPEMRLGSYKSLLQRRRRRWRAGVQRRSDSLADRHGDLQRHAQSCHGLQWTCCLRATWSLRLRFPIRG